MSHFLSIHIDMQTFSTLVTAAVLIPHDGNILTVVAQVVYREVGQIEDLPWGGAIR